MERLTGAVIKRRVRESEDLVFDSWEAADSDEEFELLAKAVELDPRNVDAWLGLLRFEPLKGDEEIAFLRRLIAMGEKNLGKKVFKEAKGIFWAIWRHGLHAGAGAAGPSPDGDRTVGGVCGRTRGHARTLPNTILACVTASWRSTWR
jgi:hypothetical protein